MAMTLNSEDMDAIDAAIADALAADHYVGGKDASDLDGTESVENQTITYTLIDGTVRLDQAYVAE